MDEQKIQTQIDKITQVQKAAFGQVLLPPKALRVHVIAFNKMGWNYVDIACDAKSSNPLIELLKRTNIAILDENDTIAGEEKKILIDAVLSDIEQHPLAGGGFRKELKADNKKIFGFMKPRQMERYFTIIENAGYGDRLRAVVGHEGTTLPKSFIRAFQSWGQEKKTEPAPDNVEVVDLSSDQQRGKNEPQLPEELRRKIIHVDAPTEWGDGDDLLSSDQGQKEPTERPKGPEFRWHTVLNALKDVGITNEQIRRIYRLSPSEHLFDIQGPAGRAQVLVDDYKEVFVIRDEEFKGKADLPFHRSPTYKTEDGNHLYLLDRSDVWKFAIHNPEQLKDDLAEYVLQPASGLKEQVKHKMSWASDNRGMQLEASIIATVIATGDIPKASGAARRVRYEFGPLAKIKSATHAKGNDALSKRSIPMFNQRGLTSNRAVWNAAVKAEPELESFYRAQPIQVQDLFRTVANNIIHGRDVKDMSDAFGTVAGRTEKQVSLALQYDGIPSINAVLAEQDKEDAEPHNVVDLDSFIEATGLAVKVDGEYLTADPDEVQSFIDSLTANAA